MTGSQRKTTSIDILLGNRLLHLRKTHHLKRTELAERIGITHQQIQKYESGTNRISVSRLYEIAEALEISASSFFDNLDSIDDAYNVHQNTLSSYEKNSGLEQELLVLISAFTQLHDKAKRTAIIELTHTLSLDDNQ